jgi:hypothetical protein
MRDQKQDTAISVYTYQGITPPTAPSTQNKTGVRSTTFRSDITKTIPRKDGFRVSTNYVAFFGKVRPSGFSYIAKPSAGSVQRYRCNGVSSTGASGLSDIWRIGCVNAYPNTVPDVSTNMLNRCYSETINKFKSGDFNMGVAVGEARRTISFITESLQTFYTALRACKRGDFARMSTLLKIKLSMGWVRSNWQNVWLEVWYGWLPLINDIYGAYQVVRNGWSTTSPLISVRRVIEWTPSYPKPIQGTVVGDVTVGVETKIYYRISDPWLFDLDKLGLINPASVLWELVPFSFVIDWFLPVSGYLQALTASVGISHYDGYQTSFARGKYKVQWVSYLLYVSGDPETVDVEYSCMRRVRLATFAPPLPYVKFGLTATRAITTIALIRQVA